MKSFENENKTINLHLTILGCIYLVLEDFLYFLSQSQKLTVVLLGRSSSFQVFFSVSFCLLYFSGSRKKDRTLEGVKLGALAVARLKNARRVTQPVSPNHVRLR